jgi:hypothetical protein
MKSTPGSSLLDAELFLFLHVLKNESFEFVFEKRITFSGKRFLHNKIHLVKFQKIWLNAAAVVLYKNDFSLMEW